MIDPIATENIVQTVSSVIVNVYPGADGGIPAWVLTVISSGVGLGGVLLGGWLQIRADRKAFARKETEIAEEVKRIELAHSQRTSLKGLEYTQKIAAEPAKSKYRMTVGPELSPWFWVLGSARRDIRQVDWDEELKKQGIENEEGEKKMQDPTDE